MCGCGGATRVSKTRRKSVATLVIGQFEAMETQRHCRRCGTHGRCDELRSLTPHRGQFGFDVIEWVGRALFVEGRNERAVQGELAARNIPISTSEIGFLSKRFIVYLALAHRACQDALREHLCAKGGYILHLDATPVKAIARSCSVAWTSSVGWCWATGKCPAKTVNPSVA